MTLSALVLPVSLALASHMFSSCDLFVVVWAVVCVFLCGPVMTGPVDGRTDGRTGLAMTEYGWMLGCADSLYGC